MNLIQLEAFIRVADSGSFSQAARELFLTQPTVSSHISGLEKELNARLFVRTTKSVSLTDQGRILYRYAYKILELEKKILQEFSTVEEESNSLTIAASTIPSQYILPRVVPAFSVKYPQVQFSLLENDSEGVVKKILGDEAEVGITGTRLPGYPCHYQMLCRDRLVIITPDTEKFREWKEKSFSLEELMREPVIMREEGSGTRKEAENYLVSQGIPLSEIKVIASISNQETIKQSVRNGLGISIISSWAAREDVQEGRILEFSPREEMYRELYLVRRKGRNLPKSARAFWDFIRDFFQSKSV